MRETLSERKSRTKISRMNWPLHAAPRPLRSAIPFLSLAPFARVFLFSLTLVYFFLLSSARAYVTAGRFIETLVTRFQVPRLARNLPRLSNPIYSLFSIAPFFLSPFLTHDAKSAFSRHSSSLFRSPGAQHPPSFLKRSILFSPLVVLHTPSPSPPSLLLPRKSSSPLSVLRSSLILSHPPFSGLLSSRFFLSAPPTFFHLPRRLLAATRRWQRARKSFSRIALREMFAFFPNHNLSDVVLFATDISIMDI